MFLGLPRVSYDTPANSLRRRIVHNTPVSATASGLRAYQLQHHIIFSSARSGDAVVHQTKRIVHLEAEIYPGHVFHGTLFFHFYSGTTQGDVERSQPVHLHIWGVK